MLRNAPNKKEIDKSLKLIVKSSLVVFIGILFSKIFSYLYRIIIARNLGPEIYGLFTLAVMVSLIFFNISCFGLHEGLSRYIPFFLGKNKKGKVQFIFKFSLKILFFTGISTAIILFLFSDMISIKIFHNLDLSIFLKIFALFIPILTIGGLFHLIIRAYERIGWHTFISDILQTSVQIIFLVLFIFIGFKKTAVIFSYNLGILSMFLASLLFCRYKISEIFKKTKINKKGKSKIAKEVLSFSWPLMFLGIIALIFSWTDFLIIGYFKNVTDVGIYNAAMPIAALLAISPSLFIQLFLPLTTKKFAKKNSQTMEEISKQIGKWIFLLNLPFAILMFIFPESIINLFFGSKYLGAAVALRFLSIGMFFYSIFIICKNLLLIAGKSKIILLNLIIALTINMILNIILVPKYGINGAAFSTMVGYIFWGLISLFQAKHYTGIIPLKRKIFLILLMAFISTILLLSIKQFILINTFTLFLQGFFFILLYSLLIFSTGCLDKNDLMILKAIKKKLS